MLKKILFATALAIGFTASFTSGGPRSDAHRPQLVGTAGACSIWVCEPGCDCPQRP
jgi:hypothetical protein